MADNRQFTDHNEIGGVNVYLEDKKLAESPEKNTVASTDYVLLKDTDGIPQKISKANLMGVVKDALADLLKSNDLGTDVTNVPVLNASAFGSATVANLASVLGVPNIIRASSYSLGNTGSVYTTDISFGGSTAYWGKMILAFMNSHAGVSVLYAIAYDSGAGSKLKVTTLAESSESMENRFSFSLNADNFLVVTCNGGGGGNKMCAIYF